VIAKTTQQRDSQPRRSAVSHAVKTHIQSRRNQYLAAAVVSGALAMPQQAPAQQSADKGLVIEEIVVTAAKREQNMQDVPIAMVALDSTALREQAITSFEDYALSLSNVNWKSFGYPGSATVYMRGAADGGDGNSSGSTPSVCIYLDEQPVTDIAANLDVHIYDINRIEALAGPQGTLFGASCQSGALRIISNQPDSSEFSGGIDVGGFGTDGGDTSYSVEGFVNIPLSDNAALRLVGWSISEGGWIDNVAGTRTYFISPTGQTAVMNNDSLIKDDFNELDKTGARAALGIDLNDNWTVAASVLYQDMETEGVWEHDTFNFSEEGKISRFNAESSSDEFTQFAVTLEGEFGNHSLVYAGSFLDRETEYMTDYSAYGEYLTWVDYYACHWGATTYITNPVPAGEPECTTLNEFATRDNEYERSTHELRLLSLGDSSLHYTLGVFFQDNEHKYLQQWIQPDMAPSVAVTGQQRPDVYFRTDQVRDLEQVAVFGELTFDFTDSLSGTIGARWFDEEASLSGVVGWGPYAFDGAFYPGDPDFFENFVNSTTSGSDTIFKANLTWNVSDDAMLFFTWSEGYRPGGINREPALPPEAIAWEPDFLTNWEVGWKTTFADGRVRLNGAAYFMDWENIQYTVYDASLSFCCGNVYNLSTAEVTGLEADITVLASDALSFSASVSFNSAETTADFVLPVGAGDPLSVPNGSPLPNVPDFKGNLVARYNFNIGDMGAYAQIAYSYTGDSRSAIRPTKTPSQFRFPGDLRNYQQDSFSIANFRAGIDKESWGVDVFVNNLTDESAEFFVHPRNYEPTVVTNRPRSYGAKLWMRF
jgi:outer membrane receptor protein involved in Fe transport